LKIVVLLNIFLKNQDTFFSGFFDESSREHHLFDIFIFFVTMSLV